MLLAQGYTPEIVKIVHQSTNQDIAAMNKKSAKQNSDGPFDHSSVVSYQGRSVLNIGIDEMDEAVALCTLK